MPNNKSYSFAASTQVDTSSSSQAAQFRHLENRQTSRFQMEDEPENEAPRFTTKMKSVEIKEGARAHFECRLNPVSDPSELNH